MGTGAHQYENSRVLFTPLGQGSPNISAEARTTQPGMPMQDAATKLQLLLGGGLKARLGWPAWVWHAALPAGRGSPPGGWLATAAHTEGSACRP